MKRLVIDLYALQVRQTDTDWETKNAYFTDKYAFLREQLEALIEQTQEADTHYRILCLSTNETMYEMAANA